MRRPPVQHFALSPYHVPRWRDIPDRYKAAYVEKAVSFFDVCPRMPTQVEGARDGGESVLLGSIALSKVARLAAAYGVPESTVISSAVSDMLNANGLARSLDEFVGYTR